MTTVDARIMKSGGPTLEFYNGLGGPATYVMFKAMDAVQSGTAQGTAGASGVSATLSGSALRTLLEGFDPSGGYRQSATAEQVAEFIAGIADEDEYFIEALEC